MSLLLLHNISKVSVSYRKPMQIYTSHIYHTVPNFSQEHVFELNIVDDCSESGVDWQQQPRTFWQKRQRQDRESSVWKYSGGRMALNKQWLHESFNRSYN
jgi:hypothetical protein